MQLFCEFEDDHSQHKYDFGVVVILFDITLKPDAESRKQRDTTVPIDYGDQKQQILVALENNRILECLRLNAA